MPAAAATATTVYAIVPGGAPVTVEVNVSGDTAEAVFDGVEGQRVSLEMSEVTIGTSPFSSAKVSLVRPDGKTLASTTVGFTGGFLDVQTLPLTGTYRIVVDPQRTDTGSMTLTLYDVPPDVTGTIVPGGAAVAVSLDTPGQNAALTFDGSIGQRISLELTDVTIGTSPCCGAKVSIVRPDGKTLTSGNVGRMGGFLDAQTLPATGTYTILVDPLNAASGSAFLTLYDVPPDALTSIVPGGSSVFVTTDVPGQNAKALFDGVAGQRVSLEITDVAMSCCSTTVAIVRPDGKTLVSATVGASGGFLDTQTLPSSGTYAIVVDPLSAATGSVVLTLYDVPEDVLTSIVPGGASVAVTTTVPGQGAKVVFDGLAGQRVSISLTDVTMGTSGCCSGRVSILKPNGQTLVGPVSFGTAGGFVDAVALPTSGTYTIVVDPHSAATGSATLTAHDVPADAAETISAGGPSVTMTTTVPGQNAGLTFSGTSGQVVSLKLDLSCCSGTMSILKPNGAVLVSGSFGPAGGFLDATTLTMNGTHTIVVDPRGDATGSVRLTLYDVPADVTASIVPGGASATVTTTVPGQNARLTFAGTAGQVVSLKLGPVCCNGSMSILKPNGAVLLSGGFGLAGGFLDATTLTENGTYTIVVDPRADATGSMTLTLFAVPADVTASIVPGGASATVTTTVPGQNARLTFDGTAGQRVSLRVGPTCCSGRVSLLRPDGTTLVGPLFFGTGGGFMDTTALPTSGTYTIVIDPQAEAVGSVTLTLYDVPADVTGSIAFGSPLGVAITTPGQNARLTFDATAGQRVSLTITDVTIGTAFGGTSVAIATSGGTVIASTSFGTNGGFIDAHELPATGSYAVVVDPLGANIGSMTLKLESVPADVMDTIVPGGASLTVTTTFPGQNARVSFDGVAGQRVSLAVGPTCCIVEVSMRNPDGTALGPKVRLGTSGGFFDAVALPATGTYTIVVDPQGPATGAVALTLYDVPPDAAAAIVPDGSAVTVTTTVPGQNASLTFAGTAGQRVSLKIDPGCCIARVSLLNPDGTELVPPTIFGGGGIFIDTKTLLATGTHTIVVDPSGSFTGAFTLTLYDVPPDVTASATLGGSAVTVTTSVPGQNAAVTFVGSENDGVALKTGAFNCCSTRITVLSPGGATVTGPASFNPDGGKLNFRLPTSGTYTALVDVQGTGTGSIHVSFELDNTAPPPPVLTLSETSADGHVVGSTLFYRPAGSGGNFTVGATVSDTGTGIERVRFPGLAAGFSPTSSTDDLVSPFSQAYTWGAGATYDNAANPVSALDKVGNSSTATFAVTPDSTPPATSDNTAALGSGWKNTDQLVILSPSDGVGSGSARTHYTTDGSTPTTSSPQGTTVSLTTDGVYTVKYFSIDNVSNVESVKTAGTEIRIDKTKPSSATLDPLPSVIKNGQVLTGSGSDALSGVAAIAYYYCAGTSCTPSTLIGSSTSPPFYSVTWSSQPADGTYRVVARVIDAAGNTFDSAARSVIIDNSAPQTTITSAPANPTNQTSASFSFTSSEGGSTFECRLDGGAWESCTSPKSYSALTAGSHTFEVRATDSVGNTDATPASRTWTIDLTAPETTLTAAPANPSNSSTASFSFVSSESGSSFQCRLDAAGFAACTSPKTYTGLAAGSHTFEVRATDAAGNVDPTPASHTWTVDLSAPETTIDAAPASPTAQTSASFSFSSSESGSSFQCRLDGASFSACTSPQGYATLADGSHTFEVRATDAAGNTDATPASHTWVVDTAAPQTTITGAPMNPSNETSASFTFTSSESGSSFECRLDAGAWESCTSPKGYSALGAGSHTFEVRATDAVGNVDATPATYTWTIDLTAPETTITAAPASPSNSSSASFSFLSSESGSSFQCRLDAGAWETCTSPKGYSGLADGSHTFEVAALDPAGNLDASAASHTWTIDASAPETTIDSGPAGATNATGASFAFSASESGSSFQCRLDAGAWETCTSPKGYSALPDGSHTFEVRATDAVGNTDATPASRTWTVDTVAPAAPAITSPANGTTNTTGDLTLVGTAEPNSSVEIFDGSTSLGTVSASNAGGWLRSFTGLADGSHTFTAKATDAAGNVSPVSNSVTVLVDATAPNTIITGGPLGTTKFTSASFSFTADDAAATFECRLDAGLWGACTAPKNYTSLTEGTHTFEVRAIDSVGHVDATPASRTWTVDSTPPPPPVITSPANGAIIASSSFTVAGTAEPGSSVQVFDGSTSKATTSADTSGNWSATVTGMADGPHTLTAKATDAAVNTSASSDAVTVQVDTTAPETTIESGPSDPTSETSATFAFSSGETGATFECSLDGSAFVACSSPQTYTGLAPGSHEFRVRATDPAGNFDATPATWAWTVV